MALPKRAASALAAEDEVQDQQRQARAEVRPRPEEAQEVDRPHVRDAGLVEPGGEEEDPQGVEQAKGLGSLSLEPSRQIRRCALSMARLNEVL
jgi:hypothetical protein